MNTADMTPSEYAAYCDRLVRGLGAAKSAGDSKSYDELAAVARELAAKCLRGSKACTGCGAAAYMGALEHNSNCPVLRLEAILERS